jgi:hypothetical protein
MGLDIKVTSEDLFGSEDRRWLGTRLGTDQLRSITLDVSAFSAYHETEFGGVPSGTALAKLASGLYGPYITADAGPPGICAGLLFTKTKLGRNNLGTDLATAGDVGAALFWFGVVKTAFLPVFAGGNDGELDAAGMTDLANFIRFE